MPKGGELPVLQGRELATLRCAAVSVRMRGAVPHSLARGARRLAAGRHGGRSARAGRAHPSGPRPPPQATASGSAAADLRRLRPGLQRGGGGRLPVYFPSVWQLQDPSPYFP